jgi:hypothetical protein
MVTLCRGMGHSYNPPDDEVEETPLGFENEGKFLEYVIGQIVSPDGEGQKSGKYLQIVAQDVLDLAKYLGFKEVDLLGFSVSRFSITTTTIH